jgi:hypothetical protein
MEAIQITPEITVENSFQFSIVQVDETTRIAHSRDEKMRDVFLLEKSLNGRWYKQWLMLSGRKDDYERFEQLSAYAKALYEHVEANRLFVTGNCSFQYCAY